MLGTTRELLASLLYIPNPWCSVMDTGRHVHVMRRFFASKHSARGLLIKRFGSFGVCQFKSIARNSRNLSVDLNNSDCSLSLISNEHVRHAAVHIRPSIIFARAGDS